MTKKRFTLKYIEEQHLSANLYDDKTFIGSIGIGAEFIVELLNTLSDENKQLTHDATVLIQVNQDYRRENHKIKSLLLKKIKDLNNDYEQSARKGMPTGGIIGELDSFEEICEIMGWEDD